MSAYYGSLSKIKTITGTIPADFDLVDTDEQTAEEQTAEEQLDDLLEDWLVVAKDYIDVFTDTTFDTNTPAGISNIAERIVVNMIGFSAQRKTSPIVKTNEFNVQLVEDKIISKAIKEDLSMYLSEHAASVGFSISISNRLTREDDEDAGVD